MISLYTIEYSECGKPLKWRCEKAQAPTENDPATQESEWIWSLHQ